MDRNSALIWLPKIQEAKLPSPKTVVVNYSHYSILNIFDNIPCKEFENLIVSVEKACDEMGYPCFIRTDLSSAKHAGPSAYKVNEPSEVGQVLFATLENNEMKFWLAKEKPEAILIREWLNLESPFDAFNGHAIAREWRFFADSEKVICFHPYWPEDSIQFYKNDEPENWEGKLAELHKEPSELQELKAMAVIAAKEYGYTASIDFAKDINGKWWLTDMAVAEDSYHWESCEMLNKNQTP